MPLTDLAASQARLSKLETRPLPLGDREAFIEVLACFSNLSLHRYDQTTLAQRLWQITLKFTSDSLRSSRHFHGTL